MHKGESTVALSESEVFDMIKRQMNKFDEVKLFYACKQHRIYSTSFPLIRIVLALHVLGLPITTAMVANISGKSVQSVLQSLHTLGDKNVLTWKRKLRRELEWMLSPWFAEKVL